MRSLETQYNIKLLPPTFLPWEPAKAAGRQVAVLMSGGVDSSVTAHLLKSAGWEVLGITMKIPVACDTGRRGCCGADAAFVCNELGLPHYFVDVTEAFNEVIIQPFRNAYSCGQTPNPCVDCNTFLKFSLVWDRLQEEFGITQLATGHYAKVIHDGQGTYLRRAADRDKDQSYFLYGIPRQRLPGLMLPLGDLTKPQVRVQASELRLSVADKAESMELCFAGEQDYRLALENDAADHPGDMTDMHGKKIGVHKGIANYTLGQRRGLGFAGGQPLYVGRIDAVANTVALGTREEVSTRIVRAACRNTLLPERLTTDAKLCGKIRSYGDPRPCRLTDLTPDGMTVEFDQAQFAPCPGQRLVLYDESDNVVTGGVIQ
ncbi:MAG: tRNA 2-thiouridine(34) synthase MnmA [Phycisphaerae bacterium]|nr:tRNA 2-thiouridine(34) synthase MnmA [Phycisphaerae bacterium]